LVRIIDQRLLPGEFLERDLRTLDDMVDAIRTLAVRGAPAIGVAAAMGLASLAAGLSRSGTGDFRERVEACGRALRGARPTAVNLAWAVDRVLAAGADQEDPIAVAHAMRREADAIREEDRDMCRRIGEFGASLLRDGMTVLTHCNTGALATAGIGTALGAIYVAHERGLRIRVLASETRPLLQGSRLTAWELCHAGIEVSVVADGAVASMMQSGSVDCCIVGADRITRRGDVANKIGTLSHAVVAGAYGVPFYVAAPTSTVDAETVSGLDVVIEERSPGEILLIAGHTGEQQGIMANNPAFDITPAELVSAIITDSGIYKAPYDLGAWKAAERSTDPSTPDL
jgi:methylthioribose-1-phosphate isomerase